MVLSLSPVLTCDCPPVSARLQLHDSLLYIRLLSFEQLLMSTDETRSCLSLENDLTLAATGSQDMTCCLHDCVQDTVGVCFLAAGMVPEKMDACLPREQQFQGLLP